MSEESVVEKSVGRTLWMSVGEKSVGKGSVGEKSGGK